MSRERILIFADYYLPSVGAGGGVRLLANIVERFSDRYDFFVVARDHDSKTDRRPFVEIPLNEWTSYGPARTWYFSKNRLSAKVVDKIIGFVRPDIIFLNSLFSTASIRFLWERRKRKYRGIPVIVSPCGEVLSEGLKHKTFKKRSYLTIANTAGLHDGLVWRATSDREKEDIQRTIGGPLKVFVVPDLVPREIKADCVEARPGKRAGHLRLSYIARIVPNKNLLFLIDLLGQTFDGKISLEIIGPREDQDYWARCSKAIAGLSPNIEVCAVGLLPHEEVLTRLHNSDVFVLPSQTENFGYVIVEALALGCPVIISDRTHWNYLAGHDFATVLSLDDLPAWLAAIRKFLAMDETEFSTIRRAAGDFADDWLSSSDAEVKMEHIFRYAMTNSARAAV